MMRYPVSPTLLSSSSSVLMAPSVSASRCARLSWTMRAMRSYSSGSSQKNARSSSSHLTFDMPRRSASGAYTSMVSRALKSLRSGLSAASVRMLCRRSASLMMTTRMSFDMARNILRRLSAWRSSIDETSMLVSLVTPSTSSATSVPKRSVSSSSEASVSSTVSWSSAAAMLSASMWRSLARMRATSTGWLM